MAGNFIFDPSFGAIFDFAGWGRVLYGDFNEAIKSNPI